MQQDVCFEISLVSKHYDDDFNDTRTDFYLAEPKKSRHMRQSEIMSLEGSQISDD